MKFDIHQVPATSSPPGRSVFILGQSTDGPINTPVPVMSFEEARRVFGQGNLIDAYSQVETIVNITVYLMRISGSYARVALLGKVEEENVPMLKFRSIYGGSRYNKLHIHIREIEHGGKLKDALIIESPESEEMGVSYILDSYETIQHLVYDINQDANAKRHHVYVSSDYGFHDLESLKEQNREPIALTGGDDGLLLTKDELYLALETSYDVLEGHQIDVICPYPVRLDDTHPAFYYGEGEYGKTRYGKADYLSLLDTSRGDLPVTYHEQLIEFCRAQERFGIMTHGVIGLRDVEDNEKRDVFYLSRLLRETSFIDRYGFVEFNEGTWNDKGHYISVFAHDVKTARSASGNGCAAYAGIIASLRPNETTSNRALPAGVELKFEMTPEELKDLSTLGVVAARHSVKRGAVITNGTTAGLEESPFRYIHNVRMVQLTLSVLNKVLESMVGESYIPMITLKETDRKVNDALGHCVNEQILKTFMYEVKFDAESEEVVINLDLMARNSVEYITAKANLRFDGGGDRG